MSTEPAKQKRKDKKKKKAMLEALQQEEYYEERAHVRLDGPVEDEEETFVVHPTDDSDEGMPLLEESDGSGACAKIIFLVLLSSLGLAVGVIFFEMGGIDSIKEFTGLSDIEQTINAPLVQPESPVAPLAVDDFIDDTIEPSPIQTDAFQDIDANVIQEAVQEVEENNLREEVPETIVSGENEQVFMEPVVEVTEHVENEETETSLAEPVEEPVVDVTEKVSEFVEEVTETVTEVIQEIPLEVNENFEAQLEDDPVEIPQESFTMRAEREAVQEAVDQVWVMTVRCIEELRALQVLAKASLTQTIIDNISQRLEPLRSKLDELVKNTSDSIFDGALEQAAELERNLRAVLDDLDQARKQDTVLAEEAARQEEELAAQSAQMAEEIEEEVESEIQAEEVDPNDEQYADEVVPEVEVVPEPGVDLKEEDTVLEQEEALETETSRLDKADPEAAPEVVASEVVSAFSEVQEIEFEIQEDEPIAQHEETVEAVANQDAVEAILEPETIESVEAVPEPETIESVEEQIIYEAPEVISGSESAPVDESLELVQSQPNEVEEPVQVAAEAFVVGQQEEQALKQNTEVPSRMQNLEEADRLVDQSPAQALALMEQILEKDPMNALGLYGRARSLDSLAEVERSNARLEQSIFAYRAVLDLEDQVDDELYLKAALRCIDRMRFRGFHGKSIRIQQRLVARFPNEIEYQNQLAVGFLLTNQPEAARTVFEEVLERWPSSGFAQVHLGFILKTTYDDYDAGARWMMAGIATREEGVIDGRFYSHLGDALERLGKHQEAQQVYAEGENERVFLSRVQRSLYNVDRLTGKPWWEKEDTSYGPFFDLLEASWLQIRDEGVKLLTLTSPEGFADESEKLKNTGDWKQFELFAQGKKNVAHCSKAPVTCTLIENYPPALCKRGQVKFSIMHPGTHVWSHTGPTNCRIRAHLGLVVPGGAELRVGNTTKSWEEGKFIIFDDSFEHEVWHKGPSYRLVLIVDLWHPELTADEWRSLAPI